MADNTYVGPGSFQDVLDPGNPQTGALQANATFLNALVAALVAANADATPALKGAVQLAGDLSGTAAAPTVAGLLKNLLTAKGQLPTASAAGVVSLLAPGTDGSILIADSTAAGGLRWVSGTVPIASFSLPGIVTTGFTALDFPLLGSWKIDGFLIRVNTAPATSPLTVDLLLNGASVYGTSSTNAPSIAVAAQNAAGGALTTTAAVGTLAAPAILDINVSAADGVAAGLVGVIYGHKTA